MTERIEKKLSKNKASSKKVESHFLILFNDDIHSFDHVIDSLIEVCDHTITQAEQCTIITHYKGSAEIRKGNVKELKKMQQRLIDKGLKASVK